MSRRPNSLFSDTSVWYALADRGEGRFALAHRMMERAALDGRDLLTSNFMVAETRALIVRRLGRFEALRYLRSMLRGTVEIVRVTEVDEARAVEFIEGYVDKAFSYADATSFAVMRRLGIETAFSFDRHVAQFGVTTLGLDA